MIIVDTNVISEPLRRIPDESVLAWLARNHQEVSLTSVTVHELVYGVRRLPSGKRRRDLTEAIEALIRGAGGRVLGYDQEAARAHASVRAKREGAGRATSVEDGMIAAIAAVHGAAVATRNVAHFEGFGIEVVNPWETNP